MKPSSGLGLALAGAALLVTVGLQADSPEAGRTIASATGEVLSGGGPHPEPQLDVRLISLDGDILDLDKLVGQRPTFLFYFSATCPHCQLVAPEMARLAKRLRGKVDVIGIGAGSNGVSDLQAFQSTYALPFPVHKDFSRRFSSSNQAVSTPTVLLVRGKKKGGFETLAEFRPFFAGASLPAELRARSVLGEDPWKSFEEGRYHGSQACGSCHRSELMSWGLTHHSFAYWTLYENKQTGDAKCVGCHVTGLGEEQGFQLGDDGSPLADVTCEACHGPGGPHAKRKPAAAARGTCVTCHDKEHSIRFDLERALPHIDHFVADALDAESFRKAREDLLEGRTPRPLLAFPEGKNLGPEACQGCHPSELEAWKKTAHAGAMDTLHSKGSDRDLACVTCHALPREVSPTATEDFHENGVSCESCHGPGEQHVAAGGGTENIVGLGDSCPVCIIEGICTSCHTPEQDPDWDLDSALGKVGHGTRAAAVPAPAP